MTSYLDRLRSYIDDGLFPDVANAREAFLLLREIGTHWHLLEKERLENLFYSLQRALLSQLHMSISRMYDPHSDRNEIRSVHTVLDFLEKRASTLKIVELPAMLRLAGMDVTVAGTAHDEVVTRALVAHFRDGMPDARSGALRAIKTRRDKALAHSEHVPDDVFPQVMWEEAEDLVQYAESLLVAVDCGYLGRARLGNDGKPLPASYANHALHQLHVLLARARIVYDERIERLMAAERAQEGRKEERDRAH